MLTDHYETDTDNSDAEWEDEKPMLPEVEPAQDLDAETADSIKIEPEQKQYKIYNKDVEEYRKFEDNMYKAMRAGPYAKTAPWGIVRNTPDPYSLLRRPRYMNGLKEQIRDNSVFVEKPRVFISSLIVEERFPRGPSLRDQLIAQDKRDPQQLDELSLIHI